MNVPNDERAPASLSIIVIDDEPDVAAYLAAMLERRGHRVYTAKNAASGFDLVKKIQPDVACIDIVMPEETGAALLRRIRADEEIGTTPVIFISALKPDMAAPHTGGGGDGVLPEPDEFIEKPPDSDAFVAAVERAARSRRATT
jgi:CheY-like chemotaxis protein